MVEPYDNKKAFKQAQAKPRSERRKKWVPKLRYRKDKFGIPSAHSGWNRHERRQIGSTRLNRQANKKGRK